MSFFIRDKRFYTSLLAIAVPITLQNLINFSVGMLDTVMLGALGETALSASSLANQPGFVFMITVFGIANGAMVINSQYWGKKEMEPIRRVFGIALKLALGLAVALMLVMLLFPEQVMRVFTPEETIIALGADYLRIIAFTYVFVGFSNVLTVALRSIEVVRISVIVSSASLVINGMGNYILIFGKFGAPALGVRGAAIATVIARMCECVIVGAYLIFFDKKLQLKLRHILGFDRALFADYLRYASPVIISEVIWSTGIATHAMILGRLGEDAVAASAICSVVQQFGTVFVFGVANACGVVIGKTVGSGNYELAHRYAKTMQVCFVGIGIVCGLVMFFIKDPIISIYNLTEGTRALTRDFLIVNSFIVASMAFTAPSMVGILRGGGDARFVMLLDLIFVWGITIPFGALAGFVLGFPLPLVYLCLKIDEPIKAIVACVRLRGTKWMRNVTRSEIPA